MGAGMPKETIAWDGWVKTTAIAYYDTKEHVHIISRKYELQGRFSNNSKAMVNL
jgi:hypothetical protein